MAREENLMMQERKDDYCKSQGFKEAKKKKKKNEWNLVHRWQEEAHRQIAARTLIQGSAREGGTHKRGGKQVAFTVGDARSGFLLTDLLT